MESAVLTTRDLLTEKIRARTAKVGIIGLGYVGLPLAMEFLKAGFAVTGIDVQASKVEELNGGRSYIQDVPTLTLRPYVDAGTFRATMDFSVIAELDTINICVPTPLRKTKDPDMSYIVSACRGDRHATSTRACWSSSNPPPIRAPRRKLVVADAGESPGLKVGKDFFLCFSPERVDPGNPKYQTSNIPKVVGGITPACTEMGAAVLRPGARDRRTGQLHAGGRDGEAARKHLPHDQHRPGERDGADVRPHGHQRLGSDRCRRHQALRLHAVLPGPRPGRPLHPDRPLLSFLEDQTGGHRSTIHRTGRLHQRPDAPLCRGQGAERAEQPSEASRRARAFTSSASPTNGISTMCANRPRSISFTCWRRVARR